MPSTTTRTPGPGSEHGSAAATARAARSGPPAPRSWRQSRASALLSPWRRAGRNYPMGVVIHRPGNRNNGAAVLASAPLRPGAGWHPLGSRRPARLHGRQRRIHIDQPRRLDRRAISVERAVTSPHTTQPDGAPDLRQPFLSRLVEVEAFAGRESVGRRCAGRRFRWERSAPRRPTGPRWVRRSRARSPGAVGLSSIVLIRLCPLDGVSASSDRTAARTSPLRARGPCRGRR